MIVRGSPLVLSIWASIPYLRGYLTSPLHSFCQRGGTPGEGALPRLGQGRPVTLAGVMRRCTEATIITAGEATFVDAPSCSVAGLARAALSLYQGVL